MDHLSKHGGALRGSGRYACRPDRAPQRDEAPETSTAFINTRERFGSLAFYGSDAPFIQEIIRGDANLGEPMHPALPYCAAEVVWAVREEMARSVEDVLARRTRALFLNARAAIQMAPRVAQILAKELGRDQKWQENQTKLFEELAKGYLVKG